MSLPHSLFTRPSTLFTFAHICSIWLFHVQFPETDTPKFAVSGECDNTSSPRWHVLSGFLRESSLRHTQNLTFSSVKCRPMILFLLIPPSKITWSQKMKGVSQWYVCPRDICVPAHLSLIICVTLVGIQRALKLCTRPQKASIETWRQRATDFVFIF